MEAVDIRGLVEKGIRQTSPTATDASVNQVMNSYDQGNLQGNQGGATGLKVAGITALMIFQPEIGFPLAVAEITGVPSPGAPTSVGGSLVAAEVSLEQRANDLHSVQSTFAQTKTTTAVGTGITQSGENVTMVASSNARLSVSQRAALGANEIPISNKGLGIKSNVKIHAETKITMFAAQNNLIPGGVAASRPICPSCATNLNASGFTAESQLKASTVQFTKQITGQNF